MSEELNSANIGGVSLREYIELLVDSKTNELKVIMAERLQAVHTAYEQHQGEHRVIGRDMEHLNELRQEVTEDRDKFLLRETFREFRGQIMGAVSLLTIAFAAIQIALALYLR